MSGVLASVIFMICYIQRNVLTVNGQHVMNVTTAILPGAKITRTGTTLKELNTNGHTDETTLVQMDTTSSDGACNSTFNCSAGDADVATVKGDAPVEIILSKDYLKAVDMYVNPINIFLYMLALIVNGFNISVFMSQDRSSTNSYLMAISVMDILYSACVSMKSIYVSVTGKQDTLFFYAWIASVEMYFKPVLQRIIFFLVFLVSIERLLVVVYPLKAKHFVFMRRPKSIIMLAVMIPVLYYIFSPLRFKIETSIDEETNATMYSYVPTQFFLQNRALLRGMSVAGNFLFVYMVLIGGLILNSVVVWALKHYSKKRQQMKTTTDIEKAAKRERQTAITIITSSFVFLLLSLPHATNAIAFSMFPDVFGPGARYFHVFLLVQNLSTILSSLSLSTDFASYFCLSTSFRTTFYRILHIKQAGSPSKCTDQMTDHTNTAKMDAI